MGKAFTRYVLYTSSHLHMQNSCKCCLQLRKKLRRENFECNGKILKYAFSDVGSTIYYLFPHSILSGALTKVPLNVTVNYATSSLLGPIKDCLHLFLECSRGIPVVNWMLYVVCSTLMLVLFQEMNSRAQLCLVIGTPRGFTR